MKKLLFSLFVFSLCLFAFTQISWADQTPSSEIVGHTLSLQNNINIAYYVENTNVPEEAEIGIKYWFNQKPASVSAEPDGFMTFVTKKSFDHGVTYYDDFHLDAIVASHMIDEVYAVSYIKDGDTYYYSSFDKYSILQYCIEMHDDEDPNFVSLLDSVLAYGGSAQKIMNYKTDRLVDEDYILLTINNEVFSDGLNFKILKIGKLGKYDTEIVDNGESFKLASGKYYSVSSGDFDIKMILDSSLNLSWFSRTTKGKSLSAFELTPYNTSDFTVSGRRISAYNNPSNNTRLIIPAIASCDGLGVAFKNDNRIQQIVLASSYQYVDESAFYNCSSLIQVSLPQTIAIIQKYLFQNCSSLKYCEIPDPVDIISSYAFSGCTSLTQVSCSPLSKITTVNGYAFSGCSSLENLTFSSKLNTVNANAFNNSSENFSLRIMGLSSPTEEQITKYTNLAYGRNVSFED